MRFIPTYVGHTGQIAQRVHRRGRFIPTYVGHTPCVPTDCGILPVHPHLRGAYCRSKHSYGRKGGSSPPTWGIRGGPSWWRSAARFIPTYVGHTSSPGPPHHHPTVHPHIRGAYGCTRAASPALSRFIPTYVGHTIALSNSNRLVAVHPHIRGAYTSIMVSNRIVSGSSPHTWGIRRQNDNCRSWFSVHPHIRGAYLFHISHRPKHFGSSPHTWGILVPARLVAPAARFIPTDVGHTGVADAPKPTPTVHPHIRGAYILLSSQARRRDGSSPHTWGIRRVLSGDEFLRRFIPTYVGHTTAPDLNGPTPTVHPHIRGAYVVQRE